MSKLSSFLIARAGRSAARRFEAATRDPVATQERKLLSIVEKNQETEYGRDYAFRAVKSLKDWQAAVPVVDYEAIKARMERVVRGESGILTAEDPVMFARTSGTTGDAKYIPVTPTCQGQAQADQMRTWIHHARRDHPTLFAGKCLSLVSPAIEGHTPSGVPYGSTSGHIYKNMPWIIRSTYAIPYEVFEIEDYEAKYYVLMRIGIGSDVTFLCTANPSSIVKMCEKANEHAESLLKDLRDGTLKRDLDVPAATRALLERRLRPDPDQAARLEKARTRRTGMLLPADYWPHLALIGCWKGGTVGTYLERFPGWFDPEGAHEVPVRDWGYLSSEARGSIPLSDEGCGGVLTVATNVYEFVATEEVDANPEAPEKWRFLGVGEVEIGREYYIFFTTTGGLYRYDINDVVEVVDLYNRTPVIVFRRKGRGMTSITGEKVSVNQVIEAFDAASHRLDLVIDHFKAEADVAGSRYVFKVEAAKGIPEGRRREFLAALDESLSGINLEYEAKRKSQRLQPPLLHVMKPGWYDNEKKKLIADGKRLFQAKTVLLSTRPAEESGGGDELEAIVSLL